MEPVNTDLVGIIGYPHWSEDLDNLKLQLTFFDHLSFADIKYLEHIEWLRNSSRCEELTIKTLVDYYDSGLIKALPELEITTAIEPNECHQIDIEMNVIEKKMEEQKLNFFKDKHQGYEAYDFLMVQAMIRQHDVVSYKKVREVSSLYRLNGYTNCFPVLDETRYWFPHQSKTNVVSVIIKNFPVPSSAIDCKELVDWKSDNEIKTRKLEFKQWVNKVSRMDLTTVELQQEIEYLINKYISYLKLNNIKYETATLKALLKIPLEFLEDLLKLKWSKIPELLFIIKDMELSLTEAELQAPGRELSYIVKAKERFGKQQ